jgi:hypothetical protein
MAPTPPLDSREALAGIIKVTPIPIEVPIHSRPVLQLKPANLAVVKTFYFSRLPHPESWKFPWLLVILGILFVVALAAVLSEVGWRRFTGKIWEWSTGLQGYLEPEDEQRLMQESPRETQPGHRAAPTAEIYQADNIETGSVRGSTGDLGEHAGNYESK